MTQITVLARMMHKFSTAPTPPSSERSEDIIRRAAPPTRKRLPPTRKAGAPDLQAGALARGGYPLAGRALMSSLRDENLCMIRA